MMNPQVAHDEGDMVVIDLDGEGAWLKEDEPKNTWWLTLEVAEKLMIALFQFHHPGPLTEEEASIF